MNINLNSTIGRYTINPTFLQNRVSIQAEILYSELLSKHSLSEKNKQIDKNGMVYVKYTRENMKKRINACYKVVSDALNELKNLNLITEKKQGLGLPNLIYLLPIPQDLLNNKAIDENLDCIVSEDNIEKEIKEELKINKKETKVINKNTVNQNIKNKKLKTYEENQVLNNKTIDKKETLVNKNRKYDNNLTKQKNNNKNKSQYKNNQIYDRDRDKYKNTIKNNIEYDIIKNSNNIDVELLDDVVELMSDVCISQSENINVNSQKTPTSIVKSRFLKLNSQHIFYILECIKNHINKISNIRAYLITTIYNSYSTMNTYYMNDYNYNYNLYLKNSQILV